MSDIEITLRKYIKDNYMPSNSVIYADGENLFDTGIIDSAGLISFISFIEEQFNIAIPDEDLLPEHFSTITAISNYIRMRKQQFLQVDNDEIEKMRSLGS